MRSRQGKGKITSNLLSRPDNWLTWSLCSIFLPLCHFCFWPCQRKQRDAAVLEKAHILSVDIVPLFMLRMELSGLVVLKRCSEWESLSYTEVCMHFMQRHCGRTQQALTVVCFPRTTTFPRFLPSLLWRSHAAPFFNFFYRQFYSSQSALALSAAALSSSKNLFVLGKIWSFRGGTQHVEQAGWFLATLARSFIITMHIQVSFSRKNKLKKLQILWLTPLAISNLGASLSAEPTKKVWIWRRNRQKFSQLSVVLLKAGEKRAGSACQKQL